MSEENDKELWRERELRLIEIRKRLRMYGRCDRESIQTWRINERKLKSDYTAKMWRRDLDIIEIDKGFNLGGREDKNFEVYNRALGQVLSYKTAVASEEKAMIASAAASMVFGFSQAMKGAILDYWQEKKNEFYKNREANKDNETEDPECDIVYSAAEEIELIENTHIYDYEEMLNLLDNTPLKERLERFWKRSNKTVLIDGGSTNYLTVSRIRLIAKSIFGIMAKHKGSQLFNEISYSGRQIRVVTNCLANFNYLTETFTDEVLTSVTGIHSSMIAPILLAGEFQPQASVFDGDGAHYLLERVSGVDLAFVGGSSLSSDKTAATCGRSGELKMKRAFIKKADISILCADIDKLCYNSAGLYEFANLSDFEIVLTNETDKDDKDFNLVKNVCADNKVNLFHAGKFDISSPKSPTKNQE